MNDGQLLVCAKIVHEANRIYCASLGDTSHVAFDAMPDWHQKSVINGVRAALSGANPRELHELWCAEKQVSGWKYGANKDFEAKTHPCLMPYGQLPLHQQAKDILFHQIVLAVQFTMSIAEFEGIP